MDKSSPRENRSRPQEITQPPLDADIEDQEIFERELMLAQQREFSGPLPVGEEMKRYGEVYAELPREIVAMAQAEQEHRHLMDQRATENEFALASRAQKHQDGAVKRGQWLGATVAIAVLGLAFLAAWIGYPTLAGVIAAIDVVGLAAVFVTSSAQNRRRNPPTEVGSENAANPEQPD